MISLKCLCGVNKFRDYLECISNDAIISCLKKRGFGIFINNHNYFRTVDTGQMLDGTGDSYGDIKVGSNGDTGLTNMLMMRTPSAIRHRS